MSTHRFKTRDEVQREATRLINEMLEEYDNSPTKVSKALPGRPNKGLIHRVAEGEYSEVVTVALGLPVIKAVAMPICMECGEVHEIKITCDDTRQKQPYRRRLSADLASDDWGLIQKWALEWRYAEEGFSSWSEKVVDMAEEAINEMPPEVFEGLTMELIKGKNPVEKPPEVEYDGDVSEW